jgi:N-acetylglutamate synthase-like GNAT family acetyltransferase
MNENLRNQQISKSIQLRHVEPQDEPFLVRVYAGERAEELALVPWDDRQKQTFVEMQYAAQLQHYRAHYPAAQQHVICADNKPVGRLYLDRGPAEFRILDLAILPENRNTGIGTFVLKNILNEACGSRLPVTVYVETFNPSLQFFEQMGFRRITQDEFKVLMRWDPEEQEK